VASKPKPPAAKTIKTFFNAIERGEVDKVTAQLAKGFDPNIRFDRGYGDEPALVHAAGCRDGLPCVRALLDAGADVRATSKRGATALHAACSRKQLAIVEALLAAGATLDARTSDGKTPYMVATDARIRKALRARGAPPLAGGRPLSPRVVANAKNIDVERGAIGADADGNMWFAGYNGLFCHDGKTTTRYVFEETFATDSVGAGPPGTVYFATNWGLLRFAHGAFTLFDAGTSELFDPHITYMRTSPDGRPYLLSYESEADHKHISVFDGDTFVVLEPGVDFPPELEIQCLAFDDRGELAIGADGALAFKRDGAWVVERKLTDSVFAPKIYDIVVDGDVMWLGTQSGVLEYRAGETRVHKTPNLAKCLCADGDSLWIGMYFGGLGRLTHGELVIIAKEDSELPHEDVEGVVRARDGTVWIHAGGGVATIRDGVVRRFD
jgi:ligand-binding sensor domain-containing protein